MNDSTRADYTEKLKTAVRLFRSEWAPRQLRRANARKWLLATHRLGDKWLLAEPRTRIGR